MSEKAKELADVVQELGKRMGLFVNRLGSVQKGLEAANRGWNEAIDKSWNGTQGVQKTIEKARSLGGSLPEITTLEPMESLTRPLMEQTSLLE